MYVLPVMDVLQIHDWTHDWNCKFMTGGLILINKPRGGIRPLKECYYTQERQSQERQDFRGRFDFAFQSALDSASAALSMRLLL